MVDKVQSPEQDSNFWLGNELLHRLTVKDIDVTLRVEMKGDRTPKAPASDGFWWNHYNKFEVRQFAITLNSNIV